MTQITRLDYLEPDIKCLIEKIYNCEYTRELKVTYDKQDQRYTLRLFYHDPNIQSITISNQCTSDQDFMNFIEKELKDRKLIRSQQYKLILYGNNES